MCDCLDIVDKKLVEYNTRLMRAFLMNGTERPYIETVKLYSSKRGKAKTMLPTFCPFCGTRYEKQKEETKQKELPL